MDRAKKFYEAELGVELMKLESPDPEIEMQAFPMNVGIRDSRILSTTVFA